MDATQSGKDYLARARALAPSIAEAAPRMEAARRLAPDVLESLIAADLFRMALPRSLGGPECDLATIVEAVEIVAAADGSTAWCLGQSVGCMSAAAYLDPAVAHDIFDDPRSLLAWGPATKDSRIERAAGGYRITGTAQFLSGLHHARWVGLRATLSNGDGRPEGARTFLFERDRASILDVWDVAGLRATGSDSIAVADLFVPDDHAFLLDEPRERREPGTLYRFATNTMFALVFAGVGLGLARAVLDAFAELAGAKTPTYWPGAMRESALVQNQYAMTEASLRAARSYLFDSVRVAWDAAAAGAPTRDHRIDLRLAASHAIRAATEAVDFAYRSAGATAVFAANPFERRFRDMHAVSQQIQGSAAQFTNVGQILLGVAPHNPRTI